MTQVIVNKNKSLDSNKKTYSVGDWLLDTSPDHGEGNTLLLLIHCAGDEVDCVYVETGETFNSTPITVEDPWEIAEEELKTILGGNHPVPARIKKVEITVK